jgi:hypothetical protein
MSDGRLHDQQRGELTRAARTTVGEELRSLTYFSEEEVEQLYLRDDLDRDADLVGFAEEERRGFQLQRTYEGTELGAYNFTIRCFDRGYLTRVLVDDHGAWVTTDGMHIQRFEEVASALASVLEEF